LIIHSKFGPIAPETCHAVAVDGKTPETCKECGFDAEAWRVRDAVTLLGSLGEWWSRATAGVDADELNRRPAPGVWSVLEYGAHTALVLAMIRFGIEQITATDGVVLPAIPEGEDADAHDRPSHLDPVTVHADLERESNALVAVAIDTPRDAWRHVGVMVDGTVIQAAAALLHAAHDASHHMMDVSRGLAAVLRQQAGQVVRVNASGGGVPKQSIGGGDVGHGGLAGDVQANRKHHGRPFQALCLWSTEVIAELAAEGHPIDVGSAGENVTIHGLDWAALRPGNLLRIGTVVAELSFPATPCAKQTGWFADGDFKRIDYDRNPHWTRWYAWVREPGRVDEGDAVTLGP
jgi:MOSC domain-containing protein YiiM